MQDARFDSLLQDVCRDIAARDLAAARRCAPRRPRKALRVAAAAAAIAALCTVGAVAVWPQVEMQIGNSRFTLRVDGVNRAAASKVEPIELGYVPEGYTVQYDEYPDGKNMTVAIVTDPQGYVLAIHRYGLDEEVEAVAHGEDGEPLSTEEMSTFLDDYQCLDSFGEVNTSLLAQYPLLVFPESDCYYHVITTCDTINNQTKVGMDPAEMMKILQNMQ